MVQHIPAMLQFLQNKFTQIHLAIPTNLTCFNMLQKVHSMVSYFPEAGSVLQLTYGEQRASPASAIPQMEFLQIDMAQAPEIFP